jgi:concentrative nucleoside transporter, CNT family
MSLRFLSGAGLLVFVGLAWLISENRRKVDWRLVGWGVALQLLIGVVMLKTPLEGVVFRCMSGLIGVLNDSTAAGASLLFGGLNEPFVIESSALVDHEGGNLAVNAALAFHVLPVIIFVSAVTAVLYHLRVVQTAVRVIAWAMRRTLKTSGAETVGTALLIFLGIESVTAIRAYLADMTRSELCTIMTAFMATIAGSVMVVYATFGAEPGHLLAASLMSAPAAIVMAKIMVPETGEPKTSGRERVSVPVTTHNVVDAAAQGTSDGLRLALNVGAMLITFIGLVYLCNLILTALIGYTLVDIMRWVFMPFACLLGVPWKDVGAVSEMLGTKSVLNEFLAYLRLRELVAQGSLSPRSVTIATYALCGFANPGSLGILIAGLTGLAPERRKDIVQLGLRALIGGTLACFMTAAMAGILLAA